MLPGAVSFGGARSSRWRGDGPREPGGAGAMTASDRTRSTALVTGASRGFGRAIASAAPGPDRTPMPAAA
jgi:hypothetical protein